MTATTEPPGTTQPSGLTFTRQLSATPTSDADRAAILADPGFGKNFTDHTAVVDFHQEQGWHNARVEAYGPLTLSPAAAVFHYGQEIFEGLKAYRHADGSVWSFRPERNAARLQSSARRLAIPELPAEIFVQAIDELVTVDAPWVPSGEGESLYLRPFVIATQAFLGVHASTEFSFRVIACPAGNYFGDPTPISIWVSRQYARAGRGGTGAAKCGGNYAASLLPQLEAEAQGCKQVLFLDESADPAVEELGGMNVFFVHSDGSMSTPKLSGSILEGITRDSIIQLAKDRGITVKERSISFTEVAESINSGEITEAFACGTAAVITPIGAFVDGEQRSAIQNQQIGQLTASLREELIGIQTGKVADRHGWMRRIVAAD